MDSRATAVASVAFGKASSTLEVVLRQLLPAALVVLAVTLVACPNPFFERVPSGPDVLTGAWSGVARAGPVGDVRVAFAPNGVGFISFGRRGIHLRAADWSITRTLDDATVSAAGFSRDDRRVAWLAHPQTGGPRLRVADAATGKNLVDAAFPDGLGTDASRGRVAFSPDGARLAVVVDDAHAETFDAATGAPLALLPVLEEGNRTLDVAFDDAGRAVTLEPGQAVVHDAATGQTLRFVRNPNGSYPGVLSADGATVAWPTRWQRSADAIEVYATADGRHQRTVNAGDGAVSGLTLNNDGTLVVATSVSLPRDPETNAPREVRQIKALDAGGALLAVLPGRSVASIETNLDLSPDGRRLAQGGTEGAAQLWTVAPNAAPANLEDGPTLPLTFHLSAAYVDSVNYTFAGTLDAGAEKNLPVRGAVVAGSGFPFVPGGLRPAAGSYAPQATAGWLSATVGLDGAWGSFRGGPTYVRTDGSLVLGLKRPGVTDAPEPDLVVITRQP